MRYEHQVIRLQTDSNYSKRLPLSICGDLLKLLNPLLISSVRMAIEGASTSQGRTPNWLTSASDVRFVDYTHEGNDTLIVIDVPSLGAAAPEIYEQKEFWSTKPAPNFTAVDVFSSVVAEIDRENQDSLLYDRQLLRRLSSMRRVFSNHLRAIALPFRESGNGDLHRLNEATALNAATLANSTPPSQEVRVVGQLDMIRRSTRSFGLKLDDGTDVRGVLKDADDVDNLRNFFDKRVLILGRAVYRPSGTLLRLDARAIEPGEGQSNIFAKVPPPRTKRAKITRTVRAVKSWDAFSKFFGKWPGEETDDQWNEMLLELKK